jgi:hypothetical protein
MGFETDVPWGIPEAGVASAAPCPLLPLLQRLAAEGLPTAVAMVDGALQPPMAPVPEDWRDVRLKTTAGMVTLSRKPGAIKVAVFGNADEALKEAQGKVCEALGALQPGAPAEK